MNYRVQFGVSNFWFQIFHVVSLKKGHLTLLHPLWREPQRGGRARSAAAGGGSEETEPEMGVQCLAAERSVCLDVLGPIDGLKSALHRI